MDPRLELLTTAERSWRHLDFFQRQAYRLARVPRVRCWDCSAPTDTNVHRGRP